MKPVVIETNSPYIARYDNVISPESCRQIIEAVNLQVPPKANTGQGLPWHYNDNVGFIRLEDKEIQRTIDTYRFLLTQLVFQKYQEYAYPHFTDLVVWRKGMKMGMHKDDGYEGPSQDTFRPRKFSSIVYLNDDYKGGETIIQQPGKEDFVSVPKQGSMVIFKSNEDCIHGVNEVTEGTRYTLATWFAKEIKYCETINGYPNPSTFGLV